MSNTSGAPKIFYTDVIAGGVGIAIKQMPYQQERSRDFAANTTHLCDDKLRRPVTRCNNV